MGVIAFLTGKNAKLPWSNDTLACRCESCELGGCGHNPPQTEAEKMRYPAILTKTEARTVLLVPA
jgi:hypothetical protein